MGLTAAERNRKKRERKKRLRDERRKSEASEAASKPPNNTTKTDTNTEFEIEYVPEELPNNDGHGNSTSERNTTNGETPNDEDSDQDINSILRRFHARSSIVVSDDETETTTANDHNASRNTDDSSVESTPKLSKRKMREATRPTVAELKTRVSRADLVEAHDIASPDPDFLLGLKAISGTVAVPRHWGRKRKYLQGKRGVEKAPFQLPDFIVKTGISQIRSAVDEDESAATAKQKNRARVAPKMGKLDVDYRTLHDAFFKHQNRQTIRASLTHHGDLYYEGKEFETQKGAGFGAGVGGPLSEELRLALDMPDANSPPPWLVNMQRYGPPPSYPNLKIPGLNAPLPAAGCSYGYHLGGWGKPPVDAFGRPLYGGNPFDPPGSDGMTSTADWDFDASSGAIVTSDGKTIGRKPWGVLPMAGDGEDSESGSDSEEEESSSGEESSEEGEEGEESSSGESMGGDSDDEDDEEQKKENNSGGTESVQPGSTVHLRKEAGDETPAPASTGVKKQLYEVLQQTAADGDRQKGAVFSSDVAYVMPGGGGGAVPEGAESVLSKAQGGAALAGKRNRAGEDGGEDDGELGKKFKF